MTTSPTPTRTAKDQEAELVQREVRRIQQLAREAVDELDIAVGIAHLRSLRSLLWRARNENIDLTEPAAHNDGSEV
jgi:hypothetical protein